MVFLFFFGERYVEDFIHGRGYTSLSLLSSGTEIISFVVFMAGSLDSGKRGSRDSPPPPPPPLPLRNDNIQAQVKLKLAPTGRFDSFNSANPEPSETPPPIGLYFFYGTLMDPGMLRDILGLRERPVPRPALIRGYTCKLWGQYPALVYSQVLSDQNVAGVVYQVQTEEDAWKLASYETSNYHPEPCSIRYTDEKEPVIDECHAFVFVGNPKSLSDGEFDIGTWLKRMGKAVDTTPHSAAP